MIAFACARCGMKFQVNDEFAGRQTACRTCKSPLTVPAASATVAPRQIDGTLSSLAQAGVTAGVSLPHGGTPVAKPIGPVARQRYEVQAEIARGGMGAVLKALDTDLRREVAVKYMLGASDPRKTARFVEEAQVTGQLEHPNIVPVHELGVDAQKRLFFSMKLVRGRSLADVLKEPAETAWSLGKLLTVFVNVCHALAYAHSRSVVHRDLKPANIMLGDFGEVYVMDWGLAKVLGEEQAPWHGGDSAPSPTASGSGEKIVTDRALEADMTQDGAILGTPVYMPPEQARGDVAAIDERSDIYSLGAILYEILTRKPPVEKDGGALQILMRVTEGQVIPPEKRATDRHVPPELSAIAMKALATKQEHRYWTVEKLRHDVELYLEGRSVSVKSDTPWETAVKMVKRNRAASVVAAAAAVVLLIAGAIFLGSNYAARMKAEAAVAAFEREQKEKDARTKEAVPALMESARYSADRGRFAQALAQATLATTYDPDNAAARLFRAQLLIVGKDVPAARSELEQYLKLKPIDRDAAQLLKLCDQVRPDDAGSFAPFVEVFLRQKAPRLAEALEKSAEKRLALYREKLDAAWPGAGIGERLKLDKKGGFGLYLTGRDPIIDLAPLEGIPLTRLDLSGCAQIRDLSVIGKLPLTSLNLSNLSSLKDLAFLQGLALNELQCSHCYDLKDLTALKGMPLDFVNLHQCYDVTDVTVVKGMPLRRFDCASTAVTDLTPLKGMSLEELVFSPSRIKRGIDVVRSMGSLKTIDGGKGPLSPEEFWKRYDAGEFNK